MLLLNLHTCSLEGAAELTVPCRVCSLLQGASRACSEGSLSFLSLLSCGKERRGETDGQESPAVTSSLPLVGVFLRQGYWEVTGAVVHNKVMGTWAWVELLLQHKGTW